MDAENVCDCAVFACEKQRRRQSVQLLCGDFKICAEGAWSGSVPRYTLTASSPLYLTMDNRRKAGPPGFFTPRSQSETRFLETFK
jgi:hypothetical protein